MGPQEGLQVLPQEETWPVHSRRPRPRPARRPTLRGNHSALRSRSQCRFRQHQGIRAILAAFSMMVWLVVLKEGMKF